MFALTLHRPWPWAIFHAPEAFAKRVENRTWRPPSHVVGRRIAIHAGKKWDAAGENWIDSVMRSVDHPGVLLPAGEHEGIIGTALLVGVIEGDRYATAQLVAGSLLPHRPDACRSVWYCGPIGWLLDGVRTLPEPIPCRGMQGLWSVPDDIARRL